MQRQKLESDGAKFLYFPCSKHDRIDDRKAIKWGGSDVYSLYIPESAVISSGQANSSQIEADKNR
jgi:hypothetical protein